ncbi:hypothetical protein FKP32DRAFT_349248 [Trametes sanguinea]|nr:hypothetical protein FKP32DRAFT_349248 [Trametes sanguinea]
MVSLYCLSCLVAAPVVLADILLSGEGARVQARAVSGPRTPARSHTHFVAHSAGTPTMCSALLLVCCGGIWSMAWAVSVPKVDPPEAVREHRGNIGIESECRLGAQRQRQALGIRVSSEYAACVAPRINQLFLVMISKVSCSSGLYARIDVRLMLSFAEPTL